MRVRIKFVLTCAKHDRWVACIGTRCDGSDDHRTMFQGKRLALVVKGNFSAQIAAAQTKSFESHLE